MQKNFSSILKITSSRAFEIIQTTQRINARFDSLPALFECTADAEEPSCEMIYVDDMCVEQKKDDDDLRSRHTILRILNKYFTKHGFQQCLYLFMRCVLNIYTRR